MNTATRRRRQSAATRTTVGTPALTARWAGMFGERTSDAAYLLLAVAGIGLVLGGQFVEDVNDSPPLQMLPPDALIARWSVVALVAYAFLIWAVLEATVRRSLKTVRGVVKIDDDAFEAHVHAMRPPSTPAQLAILVGVVVINVLLFVGLNSDLLLDDPVTRQPTKLPRDFGAAFVVLGGYVVIGWAFLRLIFFGGRLARELGRLSREPLDVNVFDTTNLLPFGNIALAVALAPAGVLVILLVGLGAPTNPVGWSVVAEATLVIVLVLLLPLRGIHRQMSSAKDVALATVNTRIEQVYEQVSGPLPDDAPGMARLSAATTTLVPLRKTIQEMTTWPFRDTVALGRALLIASAPIIYTTLSELIRVFVIGPNAPRVP